MEMWPPRHIAVEGPIGVGKTSLAKRLAIEFDAELLLEAPDENPFLPSSYQQPRQGAFAAQLFFLMQRTRQLDALHQGDIFNPVRVADFMMEKDCLFARLTLNSAEFELYQQVYSHLAVDAPAPDLVVYLQATVDVLLERIQKRGRDYEQHIEPAYLERINELYADFFSSYSQAPLFIVNAAEINFIANDLDFWALLAQIRSARTGRQFFDPLTLAAS
jgi:deoxyguanosine kinase